MWIYRIFFLTSLLSRFVFCEGISAATLNLSGLIWFKQGSDFGGNFLMKFLTAEPIWSAFQRRHKLHMVSFRKDISCSVLTQRCRWGWWCPVLWTVKPFKAFYDGEILVNAGCFPSETWMQRWTPTCWQQRWISVIGVIHSLHTEASHFKVKGLYAVIRQNICLFRWLKI